MRRSALGFLSVIDRSMLSVVSHLNLTLWKWMGEMYVAGQVINYPTRASKLIELSAVIIVIVLSFLF
jgi:hypothetical protein